MSKRLLSIMSDLLRKPKMYLGETSITRLYCYILGYDTACIETVGDDSLAKKSARFTEYLSKKYKDLRVVTWDSILLDECDGNEEAAFELLVKEWNEFCCLAEEKIRDQESGAGTK